MTGLWAFEVQLPYQKYQGPPIIVVRLRTPASEYFDFVDVKMIYVLISLIYYQLKTVFLYEKVGNNKVSMYLVIPWMLSATLTIIIPLGKLQKKSV